MREWEAVNVNHVRSVARRKLPRPIFDYVDGGADGELTLRSNVEAFDGVQLVPRPLQNLQTISQSVVVCGQTLSSPLMLAPAGMIGMVNPQGELGALHASNKLGVEVMLSSGSTYSLEELKAATGRAPWFQLYPPEDKGLVGELLDRARAVGVPVLAITVDAPVPGNRERDIINGMTFPPALNLRNATAVLSHPVWIARMLRNPRITSKMLEPEDAKFDYRTLIAALGKTVGMMSPRVTWDDIAWIRERWGDRPLLVKGILRGEDAKTALQIGATGIVVSNHGGRQLDSTPPTIGVLSEIVDACGGGADVLLDGGIRRGADVIKALCFGAKACLVGRPWVYGLGARGQRGVEAVIRLLQGQVERTMLLLGCEDVRNLDVTYIRHRAPPT